MEATLARELKQWIRVVIKCSLRNPIVTETREYSAATVRMPYATETYGSFLSVEEPGVWLIDYRTGEILTHSREDARPHEKPDIIRSRAPGRWELSSEQAHQ